MPKSVCSTMHPEVRKEALQTILAVRSGKRKAPKSEVTRGIRFFKPPPLDWNSSYQNMIDWKSKKVTITEPLVTKHLSDEDLQKDLLTPLVLPNLPCLSCVTLVSEASKQVYGEAARHGPILSRVNSREQRARYDTNKD